MQCTSSGPIYFPDEVWAPEFLPRPIPRDDNATDNGELAEGIKARLDQIKVGSLPFVAGWLSAILTVRRKVGVGGRGFEKLAKGIGESLLFRWFELI